MLNPSENPPMRPEGAPSIRAFDGDWCVAHTRARFEKAFAWDLLSCGIPYFLPMTQRVRMSGGRKRRVMAPLFTSYVFFCGDREDRYIALGTKRLCQVVEVSDQQCLVDELVAIECVIEGDAPIDFYPHAAVGNRCRVKAGPFLGIEGVVIARNGMARIVLQVSMLGVGAAVELDADLLEESEDILEVA